MSRPAIDQASAKTLAIAAYETATRGSCTIRDVSYDKGLKQWTFTCRPEIPGFSADAVIDGLVVVIIDAVTGKTRVIGMNVC